MKKHKNLLFMLVLASAFIGILIWNNREVKNPGGNGDVAMDFTGLTKRLDSLGSNPWDESAYNSISRAIGASKMADLITESEKLDLLGTLEIKATSALVMSFDKWLSDECGVNWPKINALVSTMKEHDQNVHSVAVQKRIGILGNFNRFLACRGQVQRFKVIEFSTYQANSILSNIRAAFNKEGVSSCGEMASKKREWESEISTFEQKSNQFSVLMKRSKNLGSTECADFAPYKFYYDSLLAVNKCLR
ncbi:MAG: hypothetical protein LW704_11500 [Cryomorphaceae bacterium]|jgi:hypothetical protein|nr:hypothetical protein [Cryomorphaceae bacterium]